MRFIFPLSMFLALSTTLGPGQVPFSMKYLDEVGNLGNQYSHEKRHSANLGMTGIRVEGEGETLRVEGFDEGGEKWQVRLPQVGGVGWTEVWTADFDANGRKDLL